ncbi:hypothetical protein [Methylosinus sporium]|uniref:hypothetical protein n=1 Tax=Methylosinus sporium TaxID=428 RepID=UPI00383A8A60
MEIIKRTAIEAAPGYNEMEVRFHIIDPIFRQLGYSDGENVYLNLEEKLEYPYVHIGRRSKKDVPLGFPDYRAGLKGARGSFVLEAKAGNVRITNLEVEQAHSYAAHAQVGANYFALCNGIEIRIYETLSGPSAVPIAVIPLSEVNERFHELENILSPVSLEKNCKIFYDTKLKLCDGLGSSTQVRSGEYKISDYQYNIFLNNRDYTEEIRKNTPQIAEMDKQLELLKTAFELRVADGIAERGNDGRITAFVRFSGATIHNAAAMQLLGVDRLSFVTAAKFLSKSADSPTIFESIKDFYLPKGAALPQMFGGISQINNDISGKMFVKAAIFFDGECMRGQYLVLSDYTFTMPVGGVMRMEFSWSGLFTLIIDK